MEEVVKKLDLLIKLQEESNNLLQQLLNVFCQYDEAYSVMVEKEGIISPP